MEVKRKKKVTFRRRRTIVQSKYIEGVEYDTLLEVYPDIVRLTQSRGEFVQHEVVALDPPAMDYLFQLWQEVKGASL